MHYAKRLTCFAAAACFATAMSAQAEEFIYSGVATTSDDYQLGVIWSNILAGEGSEFSLTPVENGTVAGMRQAAQGRVDIVAVGSPHYLDAINNTGRHEDDPARLVEAYEEMTVLFAIPTGMAQYVARTDAGIDDFYDLEDKSLGIGRPGGNAGRVTQTLFEIHGLESVSGEHMEYGDALDEMATGNLDATLIWGGIPDSAIDNASRNMDLKFFSPDPDTLADFQAAITNGEYYVYQEVPQETIESAYDGRVAVDGSAYFWTFPFQIMATPALSDEAAYEIVRALWENIDEVHRQSAALSLVRLETALDSISADIHPGARRYYEEVGAL